MNSTIRLKFKEVISHPIFYWALFGMILRYLLGIYTSDSYDVDVWYRTSLNMIYGLGIYDRPYFAYPPVWGYILGFCMKIGALLLDPKNFASYVPALRYLSQTGMISTDITSPAFNFILKTPLFIVDISLGYILYRFVFELTGSIKKAKSAFLLWFFNPLVILVSTIHGTFDVVPTLFTLLAVILICRNNYFLAGSMWMLGILTKIFPVYFASLLIASILSVNYHRPFANTFERIQKAINSTFELILGAFLTFIVIYFPTFLNGTLENTTVIFRRTETGVIVGGVSPWIIKNIPEYSWISGWAYSNPVPVLRYSVLITFSTLCILGIIIFLLSYTNPTKALFYGSVVTLSIIYLTAPLVNSQYLIWILPFLIIVYTAFESKYIYPFAIITFSGTLIYFSLIGIWHFLLPLATYTNFISVEYIIAATQSFWNAKGIINTYLRSDFRLISGLLGVLGIVLCLFSRKISYPYIIKKSIYGIRKLINPSEHK